MYCRKCGKEIGQDSFCKYCGEPAQSAAAMKEESSVSQMLMKLREKIRIFGHEKLIKIVSWLAAVVAIGNRVKNNEIEVVYSALAQDDYFVLSESARSFAITVIAIQVILCGLLIFDVRKRDIWVGKSMYVSLAITLLIQIAAMMLRIPAPY